MPVRELAAPPSPAAGYLRAARAAVPGLPGSVGGQGDALPDVELVVRGVSADRARLAAFARVCCLRVGDGLPATYPRVLAFGLALRLMTDRRFPLPAAGLVHVRDRISVLTPLTVDDPLDLSVRATGLATVARGTQFDLVTEASLGGEVAWREVSTYLRRRGPARATPPPADGGPEQPAPGAVWEASADIGRRYAAVSGDCNPIHLSPLTARLFGFPRSVAHGMWTAARCLAALEGRLPAAYLYDVELKRPVLLPGRVAFRAAETGRGWRVAVHDPRTGAPHLLGCVSRR